MKPPIESLRLSGAARERLIQIKRVTKLEHWNSLCRLAYCVANKKQSRVSIQQQESKSNIDMDWHTFAADYGQAFSALEATAQCHGRNGKEVSSAIFLGRLEAGIALLAGSSGNSLSEIIKTLLTEPNVTR